MIRLKHGKFISGLQFFKVGDILPDTTGARTLVEKGLAEIIADAPKKSAKSAKKTEPIPPATVAENVTSDS